MRRRLRAAERVIAELTQIEKRIPSDEKIANGLKLPLNQWREFEKERFDAGCSVNPHESSLKTSILPENLSATRGSPEHWVIRQELRLILTRAIRTLPERYQKVLCLYYGCQWTMKQIGRHLGITEGRVSQIHSAALRRMRGHMGGNGSR
jgi:RNA polymerase sigma factor for flagellar operon FliA